MIYSTHDVHPRERLSYWLEVATRGYVEHEFQAEDVASFTGSVQIATLPGVGMAIFDAAPARVRRTERAAARSDNGDLLISMVRAGETRIAQDGRDVTIHGRGLFLVDSQRPFEVDLKSFCSHLIVRIPRARLEARVGNVAGLTARPITAESGIGALAMGFLELLPKQAEKIDGTTSVKVAEQMLDLVALAFTAEENRGPTLSSPRATALVRLKATVERLLTEPGLKPDRVAAEAGISVRYANTLLAEEHTSIERFILERRLERCRNALEDRTQAHRSISEIAFNWGFSDLSHFGRRFKDRYGLTPTDYRRFAVEAAAAQPANIIQPKRTLRRARALDQSLT
ncbi:helix-turn-helix domain-containing protein [Hyphomicrobium sp. CS1GBMeth3]|uniref:AraC-like ligand-binding domain-containing protein n=1 Tax=Hyphomicrobium sp. CS1GBMeth3 TaxID=1892845 RepID=UPI000930A8DC|nr:helix-turn-helix domain-containing protein [Hyphomicrobium sp. CS1GBMeth3]